jgi:hypothetical protein
MHLFIPIPILIYFLIGVFVCEPKWPKTCAWKTKSAGQFFAYLIMVSQWPLMLIEDPKDDP